MLPELNTEKSTPHPTPRRVWQLLLLHIHRWKFNSIIYMQSSNRMSMQCFPYRLSVRKEY
jgi:hypothetical protein